MESLPTDRLAQIESVLARVDERLESLCERFEKREDSDNGLRRTIFGYNGTPGMMTEIALLKESHAQTRWFWRAVAGAAITALAGTVWTLIAK